MRRDWRNAQRELPYCSHVINDVEYVGPHYALKNVAAPVLSIGPRVKASALYYFSNVVSIASTPFQVIWTPIHSSTNAITRKIPCAVCGAMRSVIFGA